MDLIAVVAENAKAEPPLTLPGRNAGLELFKPVWLLSLKADQFDGSPAIDHGTLPGSFAVRSEVVKSEVQT
jgi:hypothetical protein